MTTTSSAKKKWFFKVIGFFLLVFLSACQPTPQPHIKPTEEFYINDRSHILLSSTKWTIYTYGEELFEDSQDQEYKDLGISGTQVVVTTYVGQIGDFNTTTLFNDWGIGENNMGLLLVLFFQQNGDVFDYKETVYEMGIGMMGHLSAFRMDGLVTQYFDDPNIQASDYDQRLISLYFGIMEYMYMEVYDYNSYNYQSFMDEYEINKYEDFPPLPSDYEREPLPTWAWVLIVVGIILFGIFPGRYILPFIFSAFTKGGGGGGRSGGYWFRR